MTEEHSQRELDRLSQRRAVGRGEEFVNRQVEEEVADAGVAGGGSGADLLWSATSLSQQVGNQSAHPFDQQALQLRPTAGVRTLEAGEDVGTESPLGVGDAPFGEQGTGGGEQAAGQGGGAEVEDEGGSLRLR